MKEQVLLAAKMYDYHKTAKRFYGSEFFDKIKWYKAVLLKWSETHKTDTLKSLMAICGLETVKENGMASLLFIAAAVEIIEPSN